MKPADRIRQPAAELAQGRRWYDAQVEGLGSEFVAAFRRAAALISDYPRSAEELAHGYRRCMLRRFPYGLVYLEKEDVLLVVAVWHRVRDPKTLWKRLR